MSRMNSVYNAARVLFMAGLGLFSIFSVVVAGEFLLGGDYFGVVNALFLGALMLGVLGTMLKRAQVHERDDLTKAAMSPGDEELVSGQVKRPNAELVTAPVSDTRAAAFIYQLQRKPAKTHAIDLANGLYCASGELHIQSDGSTYRIPGDVSVKPDVESPLETHHVHIPEYVSGSTEQKFSDDVDERVTTFMHEVHGAESVDISDPALHIIMTEQVLTPADHVFVTGEFSGTGEPNEFVATSDEVTIVTESVVDAKSVVDRYLHNRHVLEKVAYPLAGVGLLAIGALYIVGV